MDDESLDAQRLLAENAELRTRLAEAEEMLRAIRSGDVDALVVESSTGPRLFTLQGLDAESSRFRGEMLAQVSDAVIATDPEWRIVYLNPAAERQYGVNASDVLGRQLHEIYQDVWSHSGDQAAMTRSLAERGEWHGEDIHLLRDGRALSVESKITVFRDGAFCGLLAVIRDVTLRKRAEEALRESQQRMHLATEATGVGISEWNIRTNRMSWDPQMFRLYGITPTEDGSVDYAVWSRAVLPDDLGPQEELLREVLRGGGHGSREFRIRRASDGKIRYLHAMETVRTNPQGEAEWVLGTSLDITHRKLDELALREADHRKDEFLATLAHELRNPLTPVRNAVQILHLKGPVTPELQWARDVTDRQFQQMTRLIDDLMDVSRINQGKIELKRERVELARVVLGAVETSRPLIEECGHELKVSLPAGPLLVDGDLTRLAQVIWNLLNNAAKYTERGGRIELSAESQGSEVVLTVRDTGIGISEDKLSNIFEMFSQVEGALSRSQGGLGIGLFLVKRLVEMHGGTIEARSQGPGSGSEFVVRLPIVVEPSQASPSSAAADRATPTSRLRILVVDDNQDAASSLALLLSMTGNTARTAFDGEQAVEVADEFRPHVVLLDIGLPKMNGYDAARVIREHPWGEAIVLIALTGWGQDEDKRRAEAAGFDHHLVKPVDPRALMKLLAELDVVGDGTRPVS